MVALLKALFGTKNDRELKRIQPFLERTNAFESAVRPLTDEELRQRSDQYRSRIAQGESLDSVLPEAFATIREVSSRVLGQRHYDVQLVGGIALHMGRISEMKTGEGKTLTATAPIYLNALAGKGCHLVTANDYLARRDAEWMGRLYAALGLSTGVIVQGLTDSQRRAAYHSDITYGTANELGFDYLRDNMKGDFSRWVQREHNFVIVDEIDFILIDEARTPLIISGPTETSTELYQVVNSAIPGLQKDSDYIVDEKSRTVSLTEDGISKLEKRLRCDNLYDPANIHMLHHVEQAMKAHVIFKKDVDYVVRDGKVVIVDEFTGRLMPGRRYSDGLHGALEAKEHVRVENETQTLATITYQNFFRMYKKLAGMTGTADTEAMEFKKIYNLDVLVVPTNKTCVRVDEDDVVYRTAREKFNAIADEIGEAQKKGQPVLVGTVSVEKSELLSSALRKRGIEHEVLNAKNHAREAQIIEQAGQKGHVTISTNMAGRGTDIVLGDGVRELGGLYVIGTERHESRRIDNQLRGRSGRQGDPGRSKFFLSLEDDLMRIFASDRLSAIMGRLGMEEGEAIISPMVTRAIARAQRRVEEQNFSSRKHLLEYDDVMNQQRQVVYGRRRRLLESRVGCEFFESVVAVLVENILTQHAPETTGSSSWDLPRLQSDLRAHFGVPLDLPSVKEQDLSVGTLAEGCIKGLIAAYEAKLQAVDAPVRKQIESYVYLQILDNAWKDHLAAMDGVKDSVSLRGYGQRDPLQEYKKEAFRLFESLMFRIEDETTLTLIRMPAPRLVVENSAAEHEAVAGGTDDDDSLPPSMTMSHPSPGASPVAQPGTSRASQPSPSAEPQKGRMIYHGRTTQPSRRGAGTPAASAPSPVRAAEKVGRNDPCPCGSGKKYKKCHGADGTDLPAGT